MHCIICRQEKPDRWGEGEHVIPLSLGGSWTIDRVCEDCDNEMGTRWAAGLAKLAVVEDRRLEFGLVGHSGRLPNNPNSADIGVDVFTCPADSDKLKNQIYQVGGIAHHIVGHRTTSALGVDPFAQQHAVDLSLVDLENQLQCIIYQEASGMHTLPAADPLRLSPAVADSVCGSAIWKKLEQITDDPTKRTDTLVEGEPIDALK